MCSPPRILLILFTVTSLFILCRRVDCKRRRPFASNHTHPVSPGRHGNLTGLAHHNGTTFNATEVIGGPTGPFKHAQHRSGSGNNGGSNNMLPLLFMMNQGGGGGAARQDGGGGGAGPSSAAMMAMAMAMANQGGGGSG